MKILISPAKSLDFDSNIDSLKCTQPVFLNKTSQINSVLKEKSPKDLMQLQVCLLYTSDAADDP